MPFFVMSSSSRDEKVFGETPIEQGFQERYGNLQIATLACGCVTSFLYILNACLSHMKESRKRDGGDLPMVINILNYFSYW